MAKVTRRKSLQLLGMASVAPLMATKGSGKLSFPSLLPGFVASASVGPKRTIPHALFGLNDGASLPRHIGEYIDNREFMRTFAQLAPSILRYPGGTIANWFDLSTGEMLKHPSVPNTKTVADLSRYPFTWSVYKKLLDQADSESSIVLNLLTGNLESQIAALKNAQKVGVPITRIELGNEYYLAGSGGSDGYETVFPDGASYARVANKYARAVKREFPDCRIGVCMNSNVHLRVPRSREWNQSLLSTVDSSIDAVIPHIYHDPPSTLFGDRHNKPKTDALAERGGPQLIFSLALDPRPLSFIREATASRPYEIWITETNLRDFGGKIAGTWTHGLFVAFDLMNLLNLPTLNMALLHDVIGRVMYGTIFSKSDGNTFPGTDLHYQPDTLSASGMGCMMLFQAARGKHSAAPLEFDRNPMQTGLLDSRVPSLYGWVFDEDSMLVLNLSPQTCNLKIPKLRLAGLKHTQLFGDPVKYVASLSSLKQLHGITGTEINLPPYSMTRIGS